MFDQDQQVEVEVHRKVDDGDTRVDLGPGRFRHAPDSARQSQYVELGGTIDHDIAESEEATVELVYRVRSGHWDRCALTCGPFAAPGSSLPFETPELLVDCERRGPIHLALVYQFSLVYQLLVVRDGMIKPSTRL